MDGEGLFMFMGKILENSTGSSIKNFTASLNPWSHLGDGISLARPEIQGVSFTIQVIFLLERFDSRPERLISKEYLETESLSDIFAVTPFRAGDDREKSNASPVESVQDGIRFKSSDEHADKIPASQ